MTTTTPQTDDSDSDDRGYDWLLRNARELRIADERDQETESWERGRSQVGALDFEHHEQPGHLTVQLDGDPHEIVLVTATDTGAHGYVGACDCDGFRYHDGPCAHLVATAVKDAIEDGDGIVPTDPDRAAGLKNAGPSGETSTEAEVVDEDEQEAMSDVGGIGEHTQGSGGSKTVDPAQAGSNVHGSDDEPAEIEAVDRSVEQPATPSDPFAKELASDVPDRYVMSLGGDTYIRRAGFAAIAHRAGLRVDPEPVVPADETDFRYARYEAEILDENGEVVAREVGTVHAEHEEMTDAEANLDELAATRSIRRALEWATGAGASLQEGP